MRYLNRVLQDVLAIACAVAHASEQLDELGMQAVYAGFQYGALALLPDGLLDLAAALFHHFLDAGGVDAAVDDELFKRQACDLAANRIKARQRDGFRRVVDNQIDAGHRFQRADVASLAADDAALHFVIRQRNDRDGGFRNVVGGAPLNRGRDHFAGVLVRLVLCALLNVAQLDRSVVLGLLLDGFDQKVLGFLAGQAGDAFQTLQLLLLVLFRFLLAFLNLGETAGQLFVLLLRGVGLPVQRFLFLCQTTFGFLHLTAAFLDFTLEIGTAFVNFFLCLQHRFALFALCGLDGIVNNTLGFLLRAADFLFGDVLAVEDARDGTHKYADDSGNDIT